MPDATEEKVAATEPTEERTKSTPPAETAAAVAVADPTSGNAEGSSAPDEVSVTNENKQSTKGKDIGTVNNQQAETIVNKKKVKKIIKVLREQGDEKVVSHDFTDPTDLLPSHPLESLDLETEGHEQLLETLVEKHAMVVSSYDLDTAVAGAYSLIRHQRFATYERRTLILGRDSNKGRADLTIDLFLRQEYRDQKRQIILVPVDREGDFLASLRDVHSIYAETIRESLKKRDAFLLCSVGCKLLGLEPELLQSYSTSLFHWPVPFLPTTLCRSFARARAVEITTQLLDQRISGLWPRALGDFYHDIALHMRKGRLEEEVQRRLAIVQRPASEKFRETLERLSPEEVFRGDSDVHAAAVYVATYFQDLTPNDFERLVRVFLGNRVYITETESQVVTDEGVVQTLKRKVERPLVDLWQDSPDRILNECHLEAIPLATGTQVVEFTAPHLRRDLKDLLESRYPIFLAQAFRRLQEVGILFAHDVSIVIVDNLIRLSVEQTISDPAYYSRDWLVDFVLSLRVHLQADATPEDSPEKLLLLLIKDKYERLRIHFLDRLTQLIREMLEHRELHDTVRGFLDRLFAYREDDAVLYIVLELVKRLRFSTEFDALSWIKRMLDERGSELRAKAYRCLMDLSLESGPRIFEFLEALYGWLPAADRESHRLSRANRLALLFLPHYCFRTTSSFLPKYCGEWPSRYGLFSACIVDPKKLRTKLDLLASWLTHPGMVAVLTIDELVSENAEFTPMVDLVESWLSSSVPWPDLFLDVDSLEIELLSMLDFEPEQLPSTLIADLLEQWLWILEGIVAEGGADPEAHRLANALLASFAEHASPKQKKGFERRWLRNQQRYCEEINRLPIGQRERRKELQAKRKRVIELRHRFAEVGACRPEPESRRHS